MLGPGVWFDSNGNRIQNGDRNSIFFYDKQKPYYEFTNFYSLKNLMIDKLSWPTTEHYFQAQKFTDSAAQEFIRTQCCTPRDAFDCSRRKNKAFEEQVAQGNFLNTQRTDWHTCKIELMEKSVYEKFKQNPDLWSILDSTGDKVLVEDAGENDEEWGNGKDGRGKNLLGITLSRVRTQLRSELMQRKNQGSQSNTHSTTGPDLTTPLLASSSNARNTASSPSISDLTAIPRHKIPELAKKALGTQHCPMYLQHVGQNRTVVKLCFSSLRDSNNAFTNLKNYGVINAREEQLHQNAPSRNGFEYSNAISFEIPSKFLKDGMLLADYIQIVLKVADRIRELKSELNSCWTWTDSAKKIKQGKINGLEAIMKAITNTSTVLSLDAIIEDTRKIKQYRLDERRILCCGNSNTTDTLNALVALAPRPS